MKDKVNLRPATMADAEDLLTWRNDIETRKASHNMDMVSLASHLTWLESSLNKPAHRRLWIAELNGVAVGSCRADNVGDAWELSWTIASESRGKGLAKQMLSVLLNKLDKPLLAQVKVENVASMKVAETLGFVLENEDDGVLFYRYSLLNPVIKSSH